MKTLKLDADQNRLFLQSFSLWKEDFRALLASLKHRGTDLVSLLGSPLYTDSEKQQHATWFDAAELLHLIPDDFAGLDFTTAGGGEEKT